MPEDKLMKLMKNSILVVAAMLSFSTLGFSQYYFSALEKAKEIRLLEADRATVRAAFRDYTADDLDGNSDSFSSDEASIEVAYADDSCDEYDSVIWDIPAGRAIRIEVEPEKELTLEALGIGVTSMMKEQIYANEPDSIIFHDKRKGFAVEVVDNILRRFIIFPALNSKPKTCKSKSAKEFVTLKSWFGKQKLEDRVEIKCYVADVTDLQLSAETLAELAITREINVSTSVRNPNNDVLTHKYIVSAGKIVGDGAEVVWDLKGVKAGSYTITAGVDDGCAFCGQTKTKTVVIK